MKLEELYEVIKKRRKMNSMGSYVEELIGEGTDRIVQKVGEEAVEVVIAAKNSDKKRIVSEAADLFFHILILLESMNITLEDIYMELGSRRAKRV